MVYADTPLTGAVREAVEKCWRLQLDGDGERLRGGEESTSYRMGDHVVRVDDRPVSVWPYAQGVLGRPRGR